LSESHHEAYCKFYNYNWNVSIRNDHHILTKTDRLDVVARKTGAPSRLFFFPSFYPLRCGHKKFRLALRQRYSLHACAQQTRMAAFYKSYSLKNVTPPVTVKTRKWEFYDWLVGSALSSEAKNDGSCLTQITSITLVVIDAPPPAWQNKPFVFLINCRSIVILRARWCSKLKIKNGWGFNYVNNKTRGRFFCCSCFFLY